MAYGEIYIDGGTTTQTTNATPDTFDLVTGFNTAAGADGLSSGTTPDAASNEITLDEAGDYRVSFSCSFEGTGNSIVTCCAYLDGVQDPGACFRRKVGTGGDVGSAFFVGLMTVTAGQVLDVRVAADGGGDAFTPIYASLVAEKVSG